MSASVAKKEGSISKQFFAKTGSYMSSYMNSYISEVMPVSKSLIDESKETLKSVKNELSTKAKDVLPIVRDLKKQMHFKNILNWYMASSEENDESGYDPTDGMDFDTDTSDFTGADIIETATSESDKLKKGISKSIFDSSQKMVESQIVSTANIVDTLNQQTSAITAGFNKVNKNLEAILEVVTKNTSALIGVEVENGAHSYSDIGGNDKLLGTNKFDLKDYKKAISENIQNNPYLAMALSQAGIFMANPSSIKDAISPENLISMAMGSVLKKTKVSDSLKNLDNAVNQAIMDSLIRLGEKGSKTGIGGLFGKIFGIDGSRKSVDTSRPTGMAIKSIPFDTVTKEYITNAIPGYLRKILVAVGGEDAIFDPRSGSFKSKKMLKKEFDYNAYSTGNLGRASNGLKQSFGTGSFNSAAYDMLIADISSKIGTSNASNTLNAIGNYGGAKNYLEELFKDYDVSMKKIEAMAENFANTFSNSQFQNEVRRTAASKNAYQNINKSKFMQNANAYGVDYSFIDDTIENEMEATAAMVGLQKKKSGKNSYKNVQSSQGLSGSDYTNRALWAIYKRLDLGLNVFQTGSGSFRDRPYVRLGDRMLPKPLSGSKAIFREEPEDLVPGVNLEVGKGMNPQSGSNLLKNNELEDGSMESLTGEERFGRWAGSKFKMLKNGVMSGDTNVLKNIFTSSLREIMDVGEDKLKSGASKINQKYGNATGWLKHKAFGSAYDYTDENGNKVNIAKQEKGGLFGFVKDQISDEFKKAKNSGSNWLNQVKGYFDYGDKSKDPKEKGLAGKRKRLIASAVGAYAGAGILGGPIGLIAGALAGSALSTSTLGENLKEKLFGVDKKSGKATGLFTKIGDKITRPLEFQLQKTTKFLGAHLKKGLLGPLSDIGFAIKNRITAKVDEIFGGLFHKITDPIKNGAKKVGAGILKFGGNLAGKALETVFGAKGVKMRAKIGAASAMSGGVLGGVASLIAGRGYHLDSDGNKVYDKDVLKERRNARNKDLKEELKGIKSESYKDFNSRKDAERKKRLDDLASYFAEKTSENTEEIKDSTETAAQAVAHMDHLASEKGSLYTHDEGLHTRIDKIIELIESKRQNGAAGAEDNDGEFALSALGAASSMIVSGDNIDSKERNAFQKIVDQSEEGDSSNPSTVSQALADIVSANDDGKKDDDGEEKKSIFDKIFDGLSGILGNLPMIAGGIVALLALLNNPDGVLEMLKRAGDGIGNLLSFLGKENTKPTDAGTATTNAALSLLDTQVNNITDLATPGASLYHNKTDAAGNKIKNSYATEAKEELLWKAQARSQILGVATPGAAINGLKANAHLGMANLGDSISAWGAKKGGLRGKAAEFIGNKITDKHTDQYVKYDDKAKSPTNNNAVASIGRNMGRVGVITAASGIGGFAGKKIGKAIGLSEEGQQVAGNVGSIAASGALTVDMMKSAAKGKTSLVDKILDGLIKMFKIIAEKVGSSNLGKKIGASKIVKGITDLGTKVGNTVKTKITEPIQKKIETAIAKAAGSQVGTVALAGLPIIAGGLNGFASGLCGTEHLFGILPGEADAGMKTISSVLGTAFGALEMTPGVGTIVVILDILDAILIAIPPTNIKIGDWEMTFGGVGIKQTIARLLYKAFGGTENLEEKQQAFQDEKQYYADKFGVEMNDATFNDMVNDKGWWSRAWNGKASVGEDGHLEYDEAGQVIRRGGIKSIFSGSETEYAHDEQGKLITDSNGIAVKARDANGNVIKKDEKWGDKVAKGFKGIGRFFAGGNVYETDENGQAIVDDSGNYVVKEHKDGIIQKGWNFVKSSAKGYKDGILGAFGVKTKETDDKVQNFVKDAVATQGQIVSWLFNPVGNVIKMVKGANQDDTLLDDDGNPIVDDKGNPIKKSTGGLNKYLKSGFQKLTSLFTKPVDEINEAAEEADKETSAELKKNGSTSWKDLFKRTMTGLSSTFLLAGGINVPTGGPNEDKESTSSSKGTFGNPLNAPYTITSGYGEREMPRKGMHYGIDLAPVDHRKDVEVGTTEDAEVVSVKTNVPDDMKATYDSSTGQYVFNGTSNDETGNMVVLRTADGLYHKYMHLRAGSIPSNLRKNERIKAGTKIGMMGSTGFSTGEHLHYEIRDKNNNPIDPTGKIQNNNGTDFTSETEKTYPVNDSSSTSGSIISGSVASSDTAQSEEKMTFGTYISKIMGHAKKFLSTITGGLMYGDEYDPSSGSSVSGASGTYDGTTYGISGDITTSSNSSWVSIVKKVKEATAKLQPAYFGDSDGGKNINITCNGKTLVTRPDCSGIIATMLKIYGTIPETENMSSRSFGASNQYLQKDFTFMQWPGWDKLVEGDIMCNPGNHVEIFCRNDGNSHLVYNGGSKEALRNPGATYTSHKSGYQLVWRCKQSGSQSVSSGSEINGVVMSPDPSKQQVWDKLISLGYTPEAAAGIMGVWEAESGNRSNRIEGDYLSSFPGVDSVLRNNQSLNDYTNTLFEKYQNSGLKINRDAYKSGDNYYPGIGLAQWTGPRAHELYDFSKSENKSWLDFDSQIDYFNHEMNNNVRPINKSQINASSDPESAADLFARKFEGTSKSDWINKRKSLAKGFYNTYGIAAGGPNEGDSSSIINSSPSLPRSTSFAIGGPNDDQSSQMINSLASAVSMSKSAGLVGDNPVSTGPDMGDDYSTNNGNLEVVTNLLEAVVNELKTITGNTGTTNQYLNAMGKDGFVDKGLRETLSNINQIKSKNKTTFNSSTSNATNARAIAKIAKPL